MRKSITIAPTAIALALSAWTLLPMHGHKAAAQAGPLPPGQALGSKAAPANSAARMHQ